MSKMTEEQKQRIQMIDYLANQKGLSRAELVSMLERTVREAARKAVNSYQNVDVTIDERCSISCFAKLTVVEKVVDPSLEISLPMARTQQPDAQLGEEISWKIEVQNFGRIAAQAAMQLLKSGLLEAEKRRIFEQYEGQEGQLLSGVVTRIDRIGVTIDFEGTDGLMPPKEGIPGEKLEEGDHVTVLLKALSTEKGAALLVTRNGTDFIKRLFEREVSEIADGTVQIKGVSREAGHRSKVAVYTAQSMVDPVGACVGVRGTRVRNILSVLGGEKVDVVNWDPDICVYAKNALKPAELSKVYVEEQRDGEKILQVRVAEDQLSLTIGKKGMNARLASKLLGWKINIEPLSAADQSPAAASAPSTMEQMIAAAADTLAGACGIEKPIAHILVANGYHSVEGLREATAAELAELDGIDSETAERIIAAVNK